MILQGDCRDRMAEMEDNSIDSIICDPPYEIGFMNRGWDSNGIAYDQEVWRQAWRVLKPGGYLLAFGGSRTEHRLACAIEDAGFEIRDSIIWTYGSGFPKSLNVSKSINGLIPSNLRCVCGGHSTETISDSQCDCLLSDDSYGGQPLLDQDTVRCSFPSQDDALGHNHDDLRKDDLAGEPEYIPGRSSTCPLSIEDCVLLLSRLREVSPARDNILSCILESTLHASPTATHKMAGHKSYRFDLASDSASFGAYSRSPINGISRILHRCNRCNKYFALDGYGTALKPAIEIICMARKPLSEKTVAANVLRWGCGAVNVGASRIGTEVIEQGRKGRNSAMANGVTLNVFGGQNYEKPDARGRWPANLILGHAPGCVRRGEKSVRGVQKAAGSPGFGSDRDDNYELGTGREYGPEETVADWDCVEGCPVKMISEQSGQSKPNARANKGGLKLGYNGGGTREVGTWDISDEGTAARFFLNIDPDPLFYCAKAIRAERTAGGTVGCSHPTVKPLKLMRYLVRLVTPPGGVVLDPFAGSGTTLVAAKEEGFGYIGIELEPEYIEIAEARLAAAERPPATLEDFAP